LGAFSFVSGRKQSLLALSCLNFFLSGMQTAFGPIAAAYLAINAWDSQRHRVCHDQLRAVSAEQIILERGAIKDLLDA
jgi:hypothetical protein